MIHVWHRNPSRLRVEKCESKAVFPKTRQGPALGQWSAKGLPLDKSRLGKREAEGGVASEATPSLDYVGKEAKRWLVCLT